MNHFVQCILNSNLWLTQLMYPIKEHLRKSIILMVLLQIACFDRWCTSKRLNVIFSWGLNDTRLSRLIIPQYIKPPMHFTAMQDKWSSKSVDFYCDLESSINFRHDALRIWQIYIKITWQSHATNSISINQSFGLNDHVKTDWFFTQISPGASVHH